jgi:transposase
MTIENLLPNISGLELESISKSNNSIKIKLGILLKRGECPCCHEGSIRIHSRYSRNVIDLPMAGNSVVIQFNTRKYFCDNVTCERKIFTERMGEELLPYARRTKRLNDQLVKIGFATGGNPGASLSKVLGISISTSTMLRILHQTPDAEMDTPRVLGVDDWAFRKGRTYGTILPDRESSTLKIWLDNRTHGFLFINTRYRKFSARSIQLICKELREAAGIKLDVTPHTLRHTRATLLAEDGLEKDLLAKFLGHSKTETTEIYTNTANLKLNEKFREIESS